MPTVIGISGALRRGSYNAALLRSALELAPAGLAIEVASIREFPIAKMPGVFSGARVRARS